MKRRMLLLVALFPILLLGLPGVAIDLGVLVVPKGNGRIAASAAAYLQGFEISVAKVTSTTERSANFGSAK